MGMKGKYFRRLSLGVAAAVMLGVWTGNAEAVSSLSKPGEEIEKAQPGADASVKTDLPAIPSEQQETHFTISNVRLDAQELKLNKEALAGILSESVGVETTLSAFNQTVDKVTAYCRAHGYPASAAYVPAQESSDGTVTIKVIPGRYGEVRIENNSRLQEDVIRGFLKGLKPGEIIRTSSLETALYSISDLSGTKAIGVLSPGKDFGTSDLTVRVEDGKNTNTVLYAENYGSKSSGRDRFGLQESLYNVGGTGGRINVGALISNDNLHNYYANYEALVGHGGTKLGIGYSRMDYTLGGTWRDTLGASGTADTISVFGSRPIYHLDDRKLGWRFGYDFRLLKDEMKMFPELNSKKHSHSVHVGLEGYNRWTGAAADYNVTLTAGTLGTDSDFAERQAEAGDTKGAYSKLEASVTGVQALGHQTDVMLKVSGQTAFNNLDSSEDMYLGGANGVRAYPQGEGSGDDGVLGTLELRYHTNLPGLTLSTYFDAGCTRAYHHSVDGWNNTTTLKGWGVGVSYSRPNDWFARFDYARRIGGFDGMSNDAASKDRMWFIVGKIW